MTRGERKTILPWLLVQLCFYFWISLWIFLLAPAALNFFINYGSDVVEPFWSFEQYFEFILVLLFSTGLAFQLPVIQVVLGVLKIFSSRLMFSVWRYVTLGSTIIGAISNSIRRPYYTVIYVKHNNDTILWRRRDRISYRKKSRK